MVRFIAFSMEYTRVTKEMFHSKFLAYVFLKQGNVVDKKCPACVCTCTMMLFYAQHFHSTTRGQLFSTNYLSFQLLLLNALVYEDEKLHHCQGGLDKMSYILWTKIIVSSNTTMQYVQSTVCT